MDGGIGGEGCEGREDLGALGYCLNKWRRHDRGGGVLATRPVEPTIAADENLSAMMGAVRSSLGIHEL